jgi:hypothetical protein
MFVPREPVSVQQDQRMPADSDHPSLTYVAPSPTNLPVARSTDGSGQLSQRFAHEWALSKLPHLYAQAIDRRDRAALAELFTRDAVFVSNLEVVQPHAWIMALPESLQQRYFKTYHAVFNQTLTLDGETASGELYCIAHHMYSEGDQVFSNDVRIRYQDRYRLGEDSRWRFTFRRVVVVARIPRQPVTQPTGPLRS